MLDPSRWFKLFLIDKREIRRNRIPVGLQLPLPDPVTSVQQERVLSWSSAHFLGSGGSVRCTNQVDRRDVEGGLCYVNAITFCLLPGMKMVVSARFRFRFNTSTDLSRRPWWAHSRLLAWPVLIRACC